MTKIYKDAKDVPVAVTVIYTDDGKAYADAACEEQFTTSELKDAFVKGALISIEDVGLVSPFQYSEDEGVGSVSYITPNGTTATSADIASIVAKADT